GRRRRLQDALGRITRRYFLRQLIGRGRRCGEGWHERVPLSLWTVQQQSGDVEDLDHQGQRRRLRWDEGRRGESMSFKSVVGGLRRAVIVTRMSLAGCSAAGGQVLELKDTSSLKVVDATDSSKPKITISGLAMHSALAVGSIDSEIHGNAIDVTVYLVIARSG